MITLTPSRCVLCSDIATTTAAHIPVCAVHYAAYAAEAAQYLPIEQCLVYRQMCAAYQPLLPFINYKTDEFQYQYISDAAKEG